MTTNEQLRGLWFQVHKWIGIILAIILIPLSITGSILVWEEKIDRLLQPSHYAQADPIHFRASSYVAIAQRALPPGSAIISLAMGRGPVLVTAVQPSTTFAPPQRLAAWIDPVTGRVIDKGPSSSRLLRWAHSFHGTLQIPGAGRAVVGWLGVAMLISSLTGLWLWWPSGGRWTSGLRWMRQPGFHANLHHLVGFWVFLPLMMLSLTGAIIAAPQMMGRGRPAPTPAIPLPRPHLTVDQALTEASATTRAKVLWPTDKDGSWTIIAGRSAMVKIDDSSGDVTLADGDDRERPRPLDRRLHDGSGMGLAWRIVISLAGLAPAILGVTGIIMWLRRRRGRVAQPQ